MHTLRLNVLSSKDPADGDTNQPWAEGPCDPGENSAWNTGHRWAGLRDQRRKLTPAASQGSPDNRCSLLFLKASEFKLTSVSAENPPTHLTESRQKKRSEHEANAETKRSFAGTPVLSPTGLLLKHKCQSQGRQDEESAVIPLPTLSLFPASSETMVSITSCELRHAIRYDIDFKDNL